MKDDKQFNGESTIFTAPKKHNDSPKKKSKKWLVLLCSALGLAVVAGAVFGVIKLIPEKKEDKAQIDQTVTAVKVNEDSITSVKISESGDTSELYKAEGTTLWYLKGIEQEKISTDKTKEYITAISKITAHSVEGGDDAAYGVDNPRFRVDVASAEGDYTILIGNEYGDGTYIKIEGEKTAFYSVDSDTSSALCKGALAFASIENYAPVEFESDVSAYRDPGGALISFDTLTVSGEKMGGSFVFAPSADEHTKERAPYVIKSQNNVSAGNIDPLVKMFTDTVSVIGAYSYTADEQSIKAVGLDKPDYELYLRIGNECKWYKIKQVDDEHSAVITDAMNMVRKCTTKYLAINEFSTSEIHYNRLLPYSLNGLSYFAVASGDYNAEFSVTDNEGNTVVTKGGNEISDFANFFTTLSDIKPSGYNDSIDVSNPETVLTLKFTNGKTVKLSFKKGSGTKYNFATETQKGEITAAAYNKFMKLLKAF